MDNLKQQIQDILAKENYTFKQLADYLNISEDELESGLVNKTLELRHLEEISKNLRVPLYSFFREHDFKIHYNEKPVYTNKLWNNDADKQSDDKLLEEIAMLQKAIEQKQALLNKKRG